MTPRRPALRWHGGKWLLAPWICSQFPPHRVYTEAFGGAASVLLRKPKSYAEIYNDLDDEVVGLFRVLRGPDSAKLISDLSLTPFARAEFEAAYEHTDDPVERARRLVVRSFMGFGSDGHNTEVNTGFRANSNRSGSTPAGDWTNIPENLARVAARFAGVVIENRPAIDVLEAHDSPDTLHYIDPPYMPETRSTKSRRGGLRCHVYKHEMTVSDHTALLGRIRELKGAVLISGYPCELYEKYLRDWTRIERQALADGARARTEVIWANGAAKQHTLFGNRGD